MRAVAAFLALLLALASCTRRERANPLDASNPETGGAPQGFNAVAEVSFVQLGWAARPDLAIDGFQLFRLGPGDSVYRAISEVLPNFANRFFDSVVQSGSEYRYRIFYVIGGALGPRFAEDIATPGPVSAWVVDPDNGRLLRLSPDGRDVLASRPGFRTASSLAVTAGLGPVWVGDEIEGTLDIVLPSDLNGPRLTGLSAPSAIALDPIDHTAWVCDRSGAVLHFFSDGRRASPAVLQALEDPVGIATDPRDGAIWVTEFAGNRLRRFQRDGLPVGAHALLAPSRVAVDSTTGRAWVTSIASGRVWRVSPSLDVLDSLQYQSPVGVALDWRRRTAWICDVNADVLIVLDMDTRAERFRIGGLGNPWDAAVDLASGEAWIIARGSGRSFRFTASGQQLASVGGLGDPFAIRLDPGLVSAPRVVPAP